MPYVHFAPYTRSEALSIIISRLKSPLPDSIRAGVTASIDEGALSKLYPQFAATIYDSLISSTSSTSIQTFQSTCDRLWPQFIEPIIAPKEAASSGKAWTFPRLLVHHRGLFQSEGENALHNSLTQKSTQISIGSNALSPAPDSLTHRPPLLKHFPTLILLSAYLASHTQQKHDILLFSRMSSGSVGKKSRRARQTPTKKKSTSSSNNTPTKGGATPPKSRTKSVFAANATAGIPRPFALERLVAIIRAIHPHGIPANRSVSDRVYRELGELEKLRLVIRIWGPGTSTTSGEDVTDERWRVNVGREWVVRMGQLWGIGVSEYEIDTDL